jgi:anthranilate phosphoribosyltransferase
MSIIFREFLKKVGSGSHTSKNLSRAEACQAMTLMLTQEATPAQIGAFLIAHRIKRPTGEELAGMLDAYDQMGPQLAPLAGGETVVILSQPYDGRTRTFPLVPLTALVLATAGCPVLQHGGDRMPTKEGVPLIDIWRGLGIDWGSFSLQDIHQSMNDTGLGFVYLPRHFPQAQALVPYREQIGKRPPLATLELIWSPYCGPYHGVIGFVHPPTETIIQEALNLRGVASFTTVKGLEGSCDLPPERTAILGLHQLGHPLTRLCLHAQDYQLGGKAPLWTTLEEALSLIYQTLLGQNTVLRPALLWNSGFYLWQHTASESLSAGIAQAQALIDTGKVKATLEQLRGHARSVY